MMLASMQGFWIAILVIVLIYVGVRFILRMYGAEILQYFLQKLGKRAEKEFYKTKDSSTRPKPGKTTIKHKPVKRRKSGNDKDVGEYIDYEEID